MKNFDSFFRRLTILMMVVFGILIARVGQAQIKELTILDTIKIDGFDYVTIMLEYRETLTTKTVFVFKTYPQLVPEFISGRRFVFAKDIIATSFIWRYNQKTGLYYWDKVSGVVSYTWQEVQKYYYD